MTSEAPSSARTNTFEALIKESMDKFEVGVDAPATLNSDPASGHIASQRDPPNHQLPAFSLLSALSSPAILFADHAAPCRQTLGGMLLHPLSKLRRAHQAGLH
jgi:hypothetical protein